MTLDHSIAPQVSAALMRICARNSFFGALALFARFQSTSQLPTAATDGRDIFINTDFYAKLSAAGQEAVLLHEVLHAALLHVARRGGRDPMLWNVAADIVVNGMLAREGYQLPDGHLRDRRHEHLGVEEIYELLLRKQRPPTAAWADLLDDPADAAGTPPAPGATTLEDYWQHAREQAQQIAKQHGDLPAQLRREFGTLHAGQLDWRSLLWRFLVRSPTDFQGFDRRFVGQGLYLDALDGEVIRVALAVDTSGSIQSAELDDILSEVRRILRAYPHLRCDLYYADAELHGPYPLAAQRQLPAPVGGGGTDFRPFFAALGAARRNQQVSLAVYITDGYGPFPNQRPACPVLWVVTPGGRDLEQFPFGQAVRMLPRR